MLLHIEEIEQLAQIIINKFVARGVIPFADKEDIKQSIIEKYLIKEDKITASFSGKAKPKTYCSAVIYKMTCELIRSELKNWKNIQNDASEMLINNRETALNPEQTTIVMNEVDMLDKVLLTLGKERGKIELFLKYYFRLPLNEKDIENYSKNNKEVLRYMTSDVKIKDKTIYENLCKVIKVCENKTVQPDAIRMYINKHLNSIITRLNGKMNRANYTKETLGILFEIFGKRDSQHDNMKIPVSIFMFLIATILI